jgi:hypothetical protein
VSYAPALEPQQVVVEVQQRVERRSTAPTAHHAAPAAPWTEPSGHQRPVQASQGPAHFEQLGRVEEALPMHRGVQALTPFGQPAIDEHLDLRISEELSLQIRVDVGTIPGHDEQLARHLPVGRDPGHGSAHARTGPIVRASSREGKHETPLTDDED